MGRDATREREEWAARAEMDLATAHRELAVQEDVNHDIICLLAQQCAEKYLKALLQKHEIDFPAAYQQGELLGLLGRREPSLATRRSDLATLSHYEDDLRYHDCSASPEEARTAADAGERVRAEIRHLLGLDSPPTE